MSARLSAAIAAAGQDPPEANPPHPAWRDVVLAAQPTFIFAFDQIPKVGGGLTLPYHIMLSMGVFCLLARFSLIPLLLH